MKITEFPLTNPVPPVETRDERATRRTQAMVDGLNRATSKIKYA